MKKVLNMLIVTLMLVGTMASVFAMEDPEAFSQCKQKPMMLLIYADWADGYQQALNNFNNIQNLYPKDFNYVKMNIADKSAKEYNKRFPFEANLPYAIMMKNGGTIARYIKGSCVSDMACYEKSIKFFIH